MGDWRSDRVGSALAGENPTVLRRMPGGFAVIGDVQFLPGYCVLITDRPGVDRLTDLTREERSQFLTSMDLLGEAVEKVCAERCSGFRRVNLEILGNTDPFLHAHVWPRYDSEPAEIVSAPVWKHPRERWTDPATQLSSAQDQLRDHLTAELEILLQQHVVGWRDVRSADDRPPWGVA
jgi:diadenosine tetraphosphate (Ap4A) HIT family hydrolase